MEEIHPKELKELLKHKPLTVIDVRKENDFKKKALKVAENLPADAFDEKRFEQIYKAKSPEKIYFVCYKGVCSKDVAMHLEQRGFQNLVSIQGGMAGCEKEGLEMR